MKSVLLEGYLTHYTGLSFRTDSNSELIVDLRSIKSANKKVRFFLLRDEGKLQSYDDKGGCLTDETSFSGKKMYVKAFTGVGSMEYPFYIKIYQVWRSKSNGGRVTYSAPSYHIFDAPSEDCRKQWIYNLRMWNRCFFHDPHCSKPVDNTVMMAEKYVLLAKVGGSALKELKKKAAVRPLKALECPEDPSPHMSAASTATFSTVSDNNAEEAALSTSSTTSKSTTNSVASSTMKPLNVVRNVVAALKSVSSRT